MTDQERIAELTGQVDALTALLPTLLAFQQHRNVAAVAMMGRAKEVLDPALPGYCGPAYARGFARVAHAIEQMVVTTAHAEKAAAAGPPGTPH